jgi:hypothetical protein
MFPVQQSGSHCWLTDGGNTSALHYLRERSAEVHNFFIISFTVYSATTPDCQHFGDKI